LAYEEEAGRKAIESYQAALAAWKRVGDKAEEAKASQRIGITYEQLGSLEQALKAHLEALSISQEAKELRLESLIRSDAGRIHAMLGNSDRALEQCRAALSLALGAGGVREEAEALICLGEADYHHGKLEDALDSYNRAETLWLSFADRRGQAETLLLQGYAYMDLSEFDQASDCYQGALHLWRVVGDKRGEALTLVALGRLQNRLGKFQGALNNFSQAMDLVQPMGDRLWQGGIVTGMASVYEDMAEPKSALVYWEQAVELFDQAGLRMVVADVLLSLGDAYLTLEDHSNAIARFQQSLALTEKLDNRRLQSYALRYIGLAHLYSGDPKEALQYCQRSLKVLNAGEDPRFEARIFGDMGKAYELLEDYDHAFEHFSRALELSKASRDRLGEAMALFNLACLKSVDNDLDAARGYIEDSLAVAESLRTEVESRDLRSSYLASIQQYHELHIDVLMRLHEIRPREGLSALALEASERARARSLLESLVEAGVDIRRGVNPELLMRERRLKRRLDSSADRLMRLMSGEAKTEKTAALEKQIRDLTARYDQLQAEVRSRSPRYAALTQPEPLSLEDIQRRVLDDETLLLEYALGSERSYLWAVAKSTHTSYELPPRADIEKLARSVYERSTARQPAPGETVRAYRSRVKEADSKYWQEAARLSAMVLAPAAEKLKGKRLLVVSDGALQYVPFGALPVPGLEGIDHEAVPLIVEHEIVRLPSASVLAVLRQETKERKSAEKSVAVLADPIFELDDPRLSDAVARERTREKNRSEVPSGLLVASDLDRALRDVGFLQEGRLSIPRLPSTRQEAEAIIATAPPEGSFKAVDFQANRDLAMNPELGKYRIVHFATHGLVNNEHPGLSGIILSMLDEQGRPQNGFLRLHDIYNLELPVDLVVLSACNSALGKQVRGEGLVGIVRGFMYAGAERVLASLWKVDDEATGELMKRFYREMLQEGLSPAAALREAQIEMWRQSEWRFPFYWAAFVLQGEWR
jgi:CHAT domain-containing protein/tetratricopeptide (TPR) repeat protein